MSFDKPNDKHVFVATNILSRQNYVCRDKSFVAASITFVATKDVFVATKMVLVAAAANDTQLAASGQRQGAKWLYSTGRERSSVKTGGFFTEKKRGSRRGKSSLPFISQIETGFLSPF